MKPATVTIDISGLDTNSVLEVARFGAEVEISQRALESIARSRQIVEDLSRSTQPVYGISTGFGAILYL